jgi:hypothetical protein
MRTLRLSLVGTVMLALLGGLGGAVVAQEEETWTADWLAAVDEDVFTDGDCTMVVDAARRVSGPGGLGYEVTSLPFICEVTFSDPRLSGTQTTLWNERCFVEGGCTNWGTMEIVGSDGTWSGWFTGTEDPQGVTNLYIVLAGSGAYDGLTNIRHASGDFWQPLTQSGVIYEGAPPPMPELPSAE